MHHFKIVFFDGKPGHTITEYFKTETTEEYQTKAEKHKALLEKILQSLGRKAVITWGYFNMDKHPKRDEITKNIGSYNFAINWPNLPENTWAIMCDAPSIHMYIGDDEVSLDGNFTIHALSRILEYMRLPEWGEAINL